MNTNYRDCFIAALTGLCSNSALLMDSPDAFRESRNLERMTVMADRIARHAVKFVEADIE